MLVALGVLFVVDGGLLAWMRGRYMSWAWQCLLAVGMLTLPAWIVLRYARVCPPGVADVWGVCLVCVSGLLTVVSAVCSLPSLGAVLAWLGIERDDRGRRGR